MKKGRLAWLTLSGCLVVLLVALLIWVSQYPGLGGNQTASATGAGADHSAKAVLRLGLIPERDIFAQRKRYRQLGDYLEGRLGERIELRTLNTYKSVLNAFASKEIDAAFLGSLVTVLAHDQLGAQVIAKPLMAGKVGTYHGVLIVRADSSIQQVEQLAGRTVAMVRTTTAGNLFPVFLFKQNGMLQGPEQPKMIWVGTHDQVIEAVVSGRTEAGAVKNLRLEAYESAHPQVQFRRLAESAPVPNNALVVRAGLDAGRVARWKASLLAMHESAAGQAVLRRFGAERFVTCSMEEYQAIYKMTRTLGVDWHYVQVEESAPLSP